jgi:hypothetical protein
MSDWSFRHSVVARVEPEEAWGFWTTVSNWTLDVSLEQVQLDGPFAAGSRGVSKPRGSDPLPWLIREVGVRTAVIQMELPGAEVLFSWSFVAAEGGGTQITQQVTISGERVADYVGVANSQLVPGIPEGMKKLAEAVERQAR